MASCSLFRYLMWLVQLQIRELKMQWRACLRRNWLLRTLMHLECVKSIQRSLRLAMVLMYFFLAASSFMNSVQLTPASWKTGSNSSRYFSMKVMMAFPQFLGIFLVSFFTHVPIGKSSFEEFTLSLSSFLIIGIAPIIDIVPIIGIAPIISDSTSVFFRRFFGDTGFEDCISSHLTSASSESFVSCACKLIFFSSWASAGAGEALILTPKSKITSGMGVLPPNSEQFSDYPSAKLLPLVQKHAAQWSLGASSLKPSKFMSTSS